MILGMKIFYEKACHLVFKTVIVNTKHLLLIMFLQYHFGNSFQVMY